MTYRVEFILRYDIPKIPTAAEQIAALAHDVTAIMEKHGFLEIKPLSMYKSITGTPVTAILAIQKCKQLINYGTFVATPHLLTVVDEIDLSNA